MTPERTIPTAVGEPPTPAARDHAAGLDRPPARYCAFCGTELPDRGAVAERFGEPFCSEAHADEFASGVCAARVQAAARGDGEGPAAPPPAEATTSTSWTRRLATWSCWAAPLLVLAVLFLASGGGGGSAVTVGAVLSVLAALACPVAMLLMMRGMGSMQHGNVTQADAKDTSEGRRER